MRLLVVHPGAGYSTADIYNGLVPALESAGVEVKPYDLESRLIVAKHELRWYSKASGKAHNDADVVYGASRDVIERALRWNVDGVLVVSGMFLHPDLLILLRRAGLRTAILLTESPYDDGHQMRITPLADVVWTNERSSVERLASVNPRTTYLPPAFDPQSHFPPSGMVTGLPDGHDVLFIGSYFEERQKLLESVDWSGIDLGLYGQWRPLGSRSKLRQHLRGGTTDNTVAAALYRRAKIGLNLYRESVGWGRGADRVTQAESLNPRALELAACGTFQISNYRPEVAEVFGDAVPTFKTAEELGQLVRYFLQHPDERADKARRAMEAVRGHTFAAMAATILTDLDRAGWPVHSKESESWLSITAAREECTPVQLVQVRRSPLPA